MAILKIKDKGVWKEIQAIKGDTGHDVYVGDKSKAPSEAKLIIEPVRGTVTGTDIQVTDSVNDRVSKLVLDGKSTQETRSGKNLFKPLNNTSYGITTTYDKNGVGTIKGTSTSKWANISGNVIYSYPAGNYALSIDKPKTFNVNIKGTYTDKEVFEFSIFAGSKTKNVAFKKEVYSMYAYINGFEAGATFNETIKIQLEKGSTATVYEPYGVMPSPDYPSEIENVKGKNLFDGGETTTNNGITFTKNEDGTYNIKGTATAQANCYNFIDINKSNIVNGETYTLWQSIKIPGVDILIEVYNGNTWIGHMLTTTTLPATHTANISGGNRIRLAIRVAKDVTVDVKKLQIQLEKGPVATRYVPYGNIQIVETGTNLLKPTLKTTTLNGITCTANGDGSYTLNGTATKDTNFDVGVDVNLTVGKTYKFVGCPNGGSATTYRMGWNFHGYEYGNGLISKKTSETRRVQITIFSGIEVSNLIFKPMLTENTSLTYNDYEPYIEEVVNIDLKGNELCSLPNGTKDELIVKDGKAKKPKRIDEVVFTGSDEEVWGRDALADGSIRFYKRLNGAIAASGRHEILSNYFKFSNDTNEVGIGFVSLGTLYLYPKSDITTVDKFKACLSTHNTTVQYELETPEEIDLGNVSTLTTYEGTSNITNSEDTNMSIEYDTNKTNLYYQNNGNIIKMNEGS